MSVDLDHVLAARERIRLYVRETPVIESRVLGARVGGPVFLKLENLQRAGSFKIRGAMNVMTSLWPKAGVVAASAGNHAQGVALAATTHGIPSTVYMPRDAPLAKQRATADYGAQVELVDGPLLAAIEQARQVAQERGLLFLSPYDHPAIVAGQGTIGLELLEQVPDLETVLVPAGGGGLLAGVALAVKSIRPEVRVVGVQSAAMTGIIDSLAHQQPVVAPARRTIADGAAVAGPSELTLGLIQRYVDDVVAVNEGVIAQAIVLLVERARVVIEGAGALGVAAILAGVGAPRGRTAVVLSGGNIDVNALGRIVARGLLLEGRHRTLTIAASNQPGELARITSALAEHGANILEVRHEIVTSDLPLGVARLTFRLEVADSDRFEAMKRGLVETGMLPGELTDLVTQGAASMPW